MPLWSRQDSEEEDAQQMSVSWGRGSLLLWASHNGLSSLLAILKPKKL